MPGSAQFEERVRSRILELEKAGLRRTLQPPSGIDLSSNDYLGLSNHPRLKQRMADAVLEEGCGSTASRLLRGERSSMSAVERRFAAFKSMEAALYFGSGYTANLSVLTTFVERHDTVFTDAQNHASIVDGIRLSRAKRVKFRHCDIGDLARRLETAPDGQPVGKNSSSRNRCSAWMETLPRLQTTPNFAAQPIPCSLSTKPTPLAFMVREEADGLNKRAVAARSFFPWTRPAKRSAFPARLSPALRGRWTT